MTKDEINNLPEGGASATLEIAIRIAKNNKNRKDEAKKEYIQEYNIGNMERPED